MASSARLKNNVKVLRDNITNRMLSRKFLAGVTKKKTI